MAVSKIELVAVTDKWDAGLKKALDSLNRFVQANDGLEKSLNSASGEMSEFVAMIGKIDAKAQTSRGQIREYQSAFERLHRIYSQLSDAEKTSPFGKQLSSSMENLKSKIGDSQREMQKMNEALGTASSESSTFGGELDSLLGKVGLNIKSLGSWSAALAVVSGALKVVKDAFMSSESGVDTWESTVMSAESAYNSFLSALNNGDISGFLANIETIIKKAQEAYDEIDRLATQEAFAQVGDAKTRANYDQLLAQYREDKSPENFKRLSAANDKVMQTLQRQYESKQKTYLKTLEQMGRERGLQGGLLKQYVNAMSSYSVEDFNKLKSGYGKGQYYKQGWNGYDVNSDYRIKDVNGGRGWRDMTGDERKRFALARALSETTDTSLESVQKLGAEAQQLRSAMGQQQRQFLRLAGSGGGKSSGGSGGSDGGRVNAPTVDNTVAEGSINWYQQKMQEAGKMINSAASDEARASAQKMYDEYKSKIDQLKKIAEIDSSGELNKAVDVMPKDATEQLEKLRGKQISLISPNDLTTISGITDELIYLETLRGLSLISDEELAKMDELNAKLKEMKANIPLTPAEKLAKSGEAASEAWSNAGASIQTVGGALKSIDDPVANVLGLIAEAIATVALTFAKSLKGTMTPWDWIAAAAAGTATMISTIAAIKSATAGTYANGGIVGGSSYSGDNLLVGVNSGEVILNQAQSANLASKLTSGTEGGGECRPYLDGETVWLGLSRHLKRTGKGEIVTARR